METFFASLAFVRGIHRWLVNYPAQRPVTRSFDVFFDLHLNKQLSKQSWCWWFETPWRLLWRHFNDIRGSALDNFGLMLPSTFWNTCYIFHKNGRRWLGRHRTPYWHVITKKWMRMIYMRVGLYYSTSFVLPRHVSLLLNAMLYFRIHISIKHIWRSKL